MNAVLCAAMCGRPLTTLHVADVVGRVGLADLPGLAVEDVNRRRARREVDAVAAEVVGLAARDVEERERPGRGGERPVDERPRQPRAAAGAIDARAVVAEQVEHGGVVDLDAEIREQRAGLVEDAIDQGIARGTGAWDACRSPPRAGGRAGAVYRTSAASRSSPRRRPPRERATRPRPGHGKSCA